MINQIIFREWNMERYNKGRFKKGFIPWNKGLTKETDRRILSIPCSKEKREKIGLANSIALKGNIPWNKGKKCPQLAWQKGLTKETDRRIMKISLAKKGKAPRINFKHSEETKRKIGLANSISQKGSIAWNRGLNHEIDKRVMIGNKHPNWKGGLSFEPYDKRFNIVFRIKIKKRDNYVCMLCGIHQEKIKRSLDIHHINYNKLLTIPQNCVSLCISCHSKTSYNRKHWIKFFQSLLTERYNYLYNQNEEVIINI